VAGNRETQERPGAVDWDNLPPWMTGRGYSRGDGDDRRPPFWAQPGFRLGFALGALSTVVALALMWAAL
jgi:hypothetical protein